ncbi:hypothetical protein BDV95DRAFT_584647 [Massariosphaeria phaeospora]|uniref:Uncharacterized protein n=1 Tax=Massariosphaeria phaeospora TaxID=100035 RepID=A0A7C8M247_9PLEO|nr:hypothetical protein BDV95DRAFT_584647 [Massariosphaeria phaeospora]
MKSTTSTPTFFNFLLSLHSTHIYDASTTHDLNTERPATQDNDHLGQHRVTASAWDTTQFSTPPLPLPCGYRQIQRCRLPNHTARTSQTHDPDAPRRRRCQRVTPRHHPHQHPPIPPRQHHHRPTCLPSHDPHPRHHAPNLRLAHLPHHPHHHPNNNPTRPHHRPPQHHTPHPHMRAPRILTQRPRPRAAPLESALDMRTRSRRR